MVLMVIILPSACHAPSYRITESSQCLLAGSDPQGPISVLMTTWQTLPRVSNSQCAHNIPNQGFKATTDSSQLISLLLRPEHV